MSNTHADGRGSPSAHAAEHDYPSPAKAWYTVALLTCAYVVSFIDRQILGILVEPIRSTLHISDFQMGLLLGFAFSVFYVTLGIPMGWLADRMRRTVIIGAGMAVWCMMTAAGGLARNYGQLFLARIGVGVGEATLGPAAISLISDLFPREKRGPAISIYMTGVSIGGGLAYMLGGPLVEKIASAPPVVLPLLGALHAWQLTLLLVGLPGLPIALLIFLLGEPTRRERLVPGSGGDVQLPLRRGLQEIRPQLLAFASLTAGVACLLTIGYSSIWLVAFFQRSFGWQVGRIGVAIGALFIVFGPLGSRAGSWLPQRLKDRGLRDGAYLSVLGGLVTTAVSAILYPLATTAMIALLLLVPFIFASAMASAAATISLVDIMPNEFRGRAIAVYLFATSLFGLTLGPSLVGLVTDLQVDPAGLRYSMALVAIVFGAVGPMILLWGRGSYLRALTGAGRWEERR